jgi:mxaJ protein
MSKARRKPGRRGLVAAAPIAAAVAAVAGSMALADAPSGSTDAFRVCADPNNLPFSNRDGAGFENKLAALVAGKLGKRVVLVWQPQRRAYVRTGLGAGECDAIMGVPAQLERVDTTRPYYRSSYVFVYRSSRQYGLQSIKDPRLHNLSIGVQLIGNDGYNTPPAHALSEQGIVDNIVGFTVYGDYAKPNPPARIVEAVEHGAIDVAAVWGPLGGYFAGQSPVPLTVVPISDTAEFKPLLFQYDIAVGVRKGNAPLKSQIDDVLAQQHDEINRLLSDYHVPLVAARDARTGSTN